MTLRILMTTTIFVGLLFCTGAKGQEKETAENSTPKSDAIAADADANADADAEKDDAKEKKERRKDVRFPFFTVGVDAGLLMFGDMSVSAEDDNGTKQTVKISERAGVIAKLQMNLLGDGLGLEITPFICGERTGDDDVKKVTAVGGQIGLAYRFRIRRFYPKIGIGAHLAYLGGDDIKAGMEAYGRLPIGFTWYFLRFLALDFEVAPMVGATGFRAKGDGILSEKLYFDTTGGLEAVIGLRFP